jgi:hypothetical protein
MVLCAIVRPDTECACDLECKQQQGGQVLGAAGTKGRGAGGLIERVLVTTETWTEGAKRKRGECQGAVKGCERLGASKLVRKTRTCKARDDARLGAGGAAIGQLEAHQRVGGGTQAGAGSLGRGAEARITRCEVPAILPSHQSP